MTRYALLLLVACGAKPAATKVEHVKAPLDTIATSARELAGTWRWILETADNGTARVEDETWELAPVASDPAALAGRYVRTVDVRSTDRIPFQCNQRAWYRQRAVYDVTAHRAADGTFAITETAYHTEASPCDHGFRHLGAYTGKLDGGKLVLAFGDGGTQTLLQIGGTHALPDPWPPKAPLVGAWRWDATTVDEDGNVRDETEWWEIARTTDTRLDATYRRRVVVRSPDNKTLITCAHAPTYRFDDAYLVVGSREDEHWHVVETAVTPGDHACLAATPRRALDEALVEQLGDYLVLEWRGKRRQILHR